MLWRAEELSDGGLHGPGARPRRDPGKLATVQLGRQPRREHRRHGEQPNLHVLLVILVVALRVRRGIHPRQHARRLHVLPGLRPTFFQFHFAVEDGRM